MNKKLTLLEDFPEISKLNDKRLMEIFKKYRKLSKLPKYADLSEIDSRVVHKRFQTIEKELATRPHIER